MIETNTFNQIISDVAAGDGLYKACETHGVDPEMFHALMEACSETDDPVENMKFHLYISALEAQNALKSQ